MAGYLIGLNKYDSNHTIRINVELGKCNFSATNVVHKDYCYCYTKDYREYQVDTINRFCVI